MSDNISITHCSEESFHSQFLTDLANAGELVIILSPFLSHNRESFYDSTFHQLALRRVNVTVYTKPKGEQPESLQTKFDIVCQRLAYASVNLHLRSGMHEKIAAIDHKILWHGSLNILSHNDTRESMLRFESTDLTTEVLADIGLGNTATPDTIEQEEHAVAGSAAPQCPRCGSAMQKFIDVGMWICTRSPACSGVLSVNSLEDVATQPTVRRLPLQCPLCRKPLRVTQGFSTRIACSSTTCQFTMDPRISVGILKVLLRKMAV